MKKLITIFGTTTLMITGCSVGANSVITDEAIPEFVPTPEGQEFPNVDDYYRWGFNHPEWSEARWKWIRYNSDSIPSNFRCWSSYESLDELGKIDCSIFQLRLWIDNSTTTDPDFKYGQSGSGFIYDKDEDYYYMLTNHHVIDNNMTPLDEIYIEVKRTDSMEDWYESKTVISYGWPNFRTKDDYSEIDGSIVSRIYVEKYDENNDIAIIKVPIDMIPYEVNPLTLSYGIEDSEINGGTYSGSGYGYQLDDREYIADCSTNFSATPTRFKCDMAPGYIMGGVSGSPVIKNGEVIGQAVTANYDNSDINFNNMSSITALIDQVS